MVVNGHDRAILPRPARDILVEAGLIFGGLENTGSSSGFWFFCEGKAVFVLEHAVEARHSWQMQTPGPAIIRDASCGLPQKEQHSVCCRLWPCGYSL
jgi:hypothetical protein